MAELQAVIFDNKKFTSTLARVWLRNHKHKPIKRVHKTKNFLRYRLREPGTNLTTKRYFMKDLGDGIRGVFFTNL